MRELRRLRHHQPAVLILSSTEHPIEGAVSSLIEDAIIDRVLSIHLDSDELDLTIRPRSVYIAFESSNPI